MGGLTFNKCEVLSDPVIREEFGDEAADFGDTAAKICGYLSSPIQYGRKQCDGYKTPQITWAGFPVATQDLPAEFSASVDMWVGFRETSGGIRFWVGLDAGDGKKLCVKSDEFDGEIPYDAIVSQVKSLLNSAKDVLPSESTIVRLIIIALEAIAVVIAIVAAFIIASELGLAAIIGAVVEAALGGFAMVTSAL